MGLVAVKCHAVVLLLVFAVSWLLTPTVAAFGLVAVCVPLFILALCMALSSSSVKE